VDADRRDLPEAVAHVLAECVEVVMTLGQTQRAFSKAIGELICYAYAMGYEITFGDAWAKTGHRPSSNHYIRLAIDLNLFKDGVYLVRGPEMEKGHGILHDYFDMIGGAKRITNDLNHYSFEWQGGR